MVCLMIGASVDKGYSRTPAAGAILVPDTNYINVTTTSMYNVTTNGTAGTTTGQGAASSGGSGDSKEMPEEEKMIRLSYAMSLTFMVGLIQVIVFPSSRGNRFPLFECLLNNACVRGSSNGTIGW